MVEIHEFLVLRPKSERRKPAENTRNVESNLVNSLQLYLLMQLNLLVKLVLVTEVIEVSSRHLSIE